MRPRGLSQVDAKPRTESVPADLASALLFPTSSLHDWLSLFLLFPLQFCFEAFFVVCQGLAPTVVTSCAR